MPERQVGEVTLRGSSLFCGYHRQPELTEEVLRHGWLYSGDLGYMAEGRLHLVGRKKDLIIFGGRNIYPQDIEDIANQVDGVYPGRAVAFGVPDERTGSEKVILICELRGAPGERDRRRIVRDIRKRVLARMDMPIEEVHLIAGQRWVIKTASGKIARQANQAKYLAELASTTTA